jgi:hypothetical protein
MIPNFVVINQASALSIVAFSIVTFSIVTFSIIELLEFLLLGSCPMLV